jgi:hypothetical protein
VPPVAAVAGAVVLAIAIGIPLGLLTRPTHPTPAAGTVPAPRGTATEATRVYRQALAVIRGSPGFHYVAATAGGGAQHVVGDAGPSNGRQVITINSTYGMEQFTLLLVGDTVYFEGNRPALEDQAGVARSTAPSLQGKWIAVSAGDGPYSVLQPGITVAEQAQQMVLVPTSTTTLKTAGGTDAIRVLGTVPPQQSAPPGTAQLDIAAGSHVPIAYMSSLTFAGTTVTSTVTFSAWGVPPAVTAPAGVVAWSTLGATQPPGGYGSGGANPGVSPTPQGTV